MITGNTASGTFYTFNKKEQSTPIVFVHGVGLTYEIWQPQLDFFKDYSNLSYDILGHGKSSLKKQNISFDDFSDQLIELINELKIEKIHLVGFSIGSLIARNFATRYGDRLRSLVLLGSIYKRSEQQQKIVNERFNQAKKELKLSRQALKRWFTDKYLENNPDTYEKISSILSGNNMTNFLTFQNDWNPWKLYIYNFKLSVGTLTTQRSPIMPPTTLHSGGFGWFGGPLRKMSGETKLKICGQYLGISVNIHRERRVK